MKRYWLYLVLSVILVVFALYGCIKPNNPPEVSLVAPENGSSVKPPVTLKWKMSDKDGDELTVEVFVYEKGATSKTPATTLKNATSYVFEDAKPHTTYEWYVKVSDGKDSKKSDVWSFTVGNRAPVWADIPEQSVKEGNTLKLDLKDYVGDPDGDDVTITLKEGSGTIDKNGVYTWTPRYEDAGTYTIRVKASDGSLESEASFTVVVNNVNRPPFWAEDKISVQLEEGDSTTVTLKDKSRDKDEYDTWDKLSYEFVGTYPSTIMSLEYVEGEGTVLRMETTAEASGMYQAHLAVVDTYNASAVVPVYVIVGNVDRAPEWVNVADLEANLVVNENSTKTVDLSKYVKDPDEYDAPAEMSYEIVEGKKDWMKIEGTTLKLMPGYDASGTYDIELKVTDKFDKSDAIAVKVLVKNIDRAPKWVNLISPQDEETDVSPMPKFEWNAYDPDVSEVGDDSLTYTLYLKREGEEEWEELTADSTPFELPEGSNLEYNAHYFWYVVATDEGGKSATSDIWEFVTTDEGYIYIKLNKDVVKSGDTVTAEVYMDNFANINLFEIGLEVEGDGLEVLDIKSELEGLNIPASDTSHATLTYSWGRSASEDIKDMKIFTVTLKAENTGEEVLTPVLKISDGSVIARINGDNIEKLDYKPDSKKVEVYPKYAAVFTVSPESTVIYQTKEKTFDVYLTTFGTVNALDMWLNLPADFTVESSECYLTGDPGDWTNGHYIVGFRSGRVFDNEKICSFTVKANNNAELGQKELGVVGQVCDFEENKFYVEPATVTFEVRKSIYGELKLQTNEEAKLWNKFEGTVSGENFIGNPAAIEIDITGLPRDATVVQKINVPIFDPKVIDNGYRLLIGSKDGIDLNQDLFNLEATPNEMANIRIVVNATALTKDEDEFQLEGDEEKVEVYFGKVSAESTIVESGTETSITLLFTDFATPVQAIHLLIPYNDYFDVQESSGTGNGYYIVKETENGYIVDVAFDEPQEISNYKLSLRIKAKSTSTDYVTVNFVEAKAVVDVDTGEEYDLKVVSPIKIWVTNK